MPVDEAPARIAALLDERKRLERELSEAKKRLAMGGGKAAGADGMRAVGDIKLMARAVEGIDLKDLRSLADEGKKNRRLRRRRHRGRDRGRQGRNRRRRHQRSRGALQRRRSGAKGAEVLGGKGGGGRPDMAQAGGPDGSKAGAALDAVEAALGNDIGYPDGRRWRPTRPPPPAPLFRRFWCNTGSWKSEVNCSLTALSLPNVRKLSATRGCTMSPRAAACPKTLKLVVMTVGPSYFSASIACWRNPWLRVARSALPPSC